MKKIFISIILIISVNFVISQNPFSINSNNQLVWKKIYNEKLEIENQQILLKPNKNGLAIYLRDIHSAKMIIQNKDNKTRIIVKEIKSLTSLDEEPDYIDGIVINKKGEFRKFFIKRDKEVLNEIIEKSVNSIIEENSW